MIKRKSDMLMGEESKTIKDLNILIEKRCGTRLINPTLLFNNNGLRFPVSYLNKIRLNVILLPLESMATYCDRVTKSLVDQKSNTFLHDKVFSLDMNTFNGFDRMNATSIGNLAYICLRSHNQDAKRVVENYLNMIHEAFENNKTKCQ